MSEHDESQQQDLVSIQQAAAKFGISTRTVRRYIDAGIMTGYRIGPRLIRVDLTQLQQATSRMPASNRED